MAENGPDAGRIEVWLRGMRDEKVHCFKSNSSGKVTIQTDDVTFAGDVIQSLAMYLGVRELSSEATFPAEETRMLEALERVKGTSLGGGDLKRSEAILRTTANRFRAEKYHLLNGSCCFQRTFRPIYVTFLRFERG